MVKFLRTSKIASIILAIIRIYLGVLWTMAGWEKITGGASGAVKGLLTNAVKNPVTGPTGKVVYPWFNDMLSAILPHYKGMSLMVSWGEFLVGLGLIFGCLTTAEASIYVDRNFKGHGLGTALYQKLEDALCSQGVVNLMACITEGNENSIHFHEKFGYKEVGTFVKVGYKFNRWLDVTWMQKSLNPRTDNMKKIISYNKLS